MGFFSTLGSKISHAAHHLGQKAKSVAHKVAKVSDVVANRPKVQTFVLKVCIFQSGSNTNEFS